jgi:uncharacterized oxidoreductase
MSREVVPDASIAWIVASLRHRPIPPGVALAIAGQEKLNPAALPLDGFLAEALSINTRNPTPNEVVVQAAQRLRWAERDGTYAGLLRQRSESLSTLPGR